jgi:hypothetical protein
MWQTSITPGALALLPAPGAAITDTWHVAFSGAQRNGFARPTASVTYASSQPTAAPTPPPAAPTQGPPGQPGTAVLPGIGTDGVTGTVGPSGPAPTVAGQPTQGSGLVPVSVTLPRFRYKGVFLLPLVLVAAAAWLGRALTREL